MIVANATSGPVGMIRLASEPYSDSTLGVVAGSPVVTLGDGASTTVRVGMLGRAPVVVSLSNGPIKTGDKVTTSSLPGLGMRANRPGYVLGTALEPFDPASGIGACESGSVESNTCTGRSLVSLNPGFSVGGTDVFDTFGATTTTLSLAMTELGNAVLGNVREAVKLVVGKVVARIGIFEKIFVKETRTEKLCVSDDTGAETCITKAQLDAMLMSAGSSSAVVVPPPPTPPEGPENTGGTEENPEEPTPSEEAGETVSDVSSGGDVADVGADTAPQDPPMPESPVEEPVL